MLTAVFGIWKEPGNGLALLKLEDRVLNVLECCCVTGLVKTWHWREGESHIACSRKDNIPWGLDIKAPLHLRSGGFLVS